MPAAVICGARPWQPRPHRSGNSSPAAAQPLTQLLLTGVPAHRFCICKYRAGIYEVLLRSYVLNSHFAEQIPLKNMHTQSKHIRNQDTNFRTFTPAASKHEKETPPVCEDYKWQSSSAQNQAHHPRNVQTPVHPWEAVPNL